MKIVETIYTGHNWMSGDDVDRCVEVTLIDDEGKVISSVSFAEGEPEDMVLFRNLSDAYSIAGLVKEAYELGHRGVDVKFESKTKSY